MLYPTPELSVADQVVLTDIEEKRQSLRFQIQNSPANWTAGLRRFLTADAVAASNHIEGFRVSTADVHLVSVDPWADGNGRMSRPLQTLLIAREGVLAPEFSSIEAWLGRPRRTWAYYGELQGRGPVYRPGQDVSGWIRFNLTACQPRARTSPSRCSRWRANR